MVADTLGVDSPLSDSDEQSHHLQAMGGKCHSSDIAHGLCVRENSILASDTPYLEWLEVGPKESSQDRFHNTMWTKDLNVL